MKIYRLSSAILALLLIGIAVPGQEITGKHRKIFTPAGGAPSLGVHASASSGAATSTTGLTTTGVTTQGSGSSFYICTSFDNTASVSSVLDSKGNTYSQSGTNVTFLSVILARYKSINGTGGASHTFTVKPNITSVMSVWAVEIKNSTGGVDQQNAATTSSSPFDSPSVTTGTANEVLIGCAIDNSSGTGDNFTAGQSFTLLDQVTDGSSFITGASSGRAVSATGTYKSEFTSVQGSTMAVSIDTFK